MDWLYRLMLAFIVAIGLAGVEETMSALKPPAMKVTLHALLAPGPLPPPPPMPAAPGGSGLKPALRYEGSLTSDRIALPWHSSRSTRPSMKPPSAR